jgi:N-formylglutamate deformylase
MQVLAAQDSYTQVTDGRFKGGFITRHYGRPPTACTRCSWRCAGRTYMDEQPPYAWTPPRAAQLEPVLRALLQTALGWRPDA